MKKLFLFTVAAVLFAAKGFSQDDGLKGTWFATAQFGYQDTGSLKTTTFIPIIGTFVAPTTAIGIGGGVISSKPEGGKSATTTVIEPLVRKYWNVSGNLFFFGQGAVPILLSDGSNTYGVTVTPGLDYVVNSWFTVEFSATLLNFSVTSPDSGSSTTSFSFNPMAHSALGTTAQVGFKFLF